MRKHLTIAVLLLVFLTSAFGQSKKLQRKRFDILINKNLNYAVDKAFVNTIISPADSTIALNTAYQTIFNDDKTKFVIFFLEQFAPQDFTAFRNSKKDKYVNILTTKDIMKGGTLDDLNTYAYIVKGAKYNDKWYYEKTRITYFATRTLKEGQQEFFNNLQTWNFFKKRSTGLNPDFWESVLFEKVPAKLSNDSSWAPYVGLYSVVANQMKREKKELAHKKELDIINKYIRPLTHKLKVENSYEIVSTNQMSKDFLLIYPSAFAPILCPVNVKEKDKDMYIRYFVLLPQNDTYKIYEWSFLDPSHFKNSHIGPSFMDQINTLTIWNYTFVKLDDMKFWNDYVLLKSDGAYKYLKEVQ
ncbi:MAG: hypothetical protein JWO09_3907 [Bacteroidetes bacterium]|nr:hypothetical protein [Bacteroidota bacterium]